jgi:excisionase family DNA binding protein
VTTTRPDLATLLAQLAQALLAEQQHHHQSVAEPEAPRSSPLLLTVEEAAERLRIGKTKAYELVRSGALESVRIGRLRRIHQDAITQYAANLVTAHHRAISAA